MRMLAPIPILCFAVSWSARSAEAATGEHGDPISVAVLDVRAVGELEPKRAEGLSSVLGSAIEGPGIAVVRSDDVRSLLGYEAERQLAGCQDDSACLTEIAGAMGATYLLASEISRFGGTWVFSAALLSARTSEGLLRVSRRTDSVDALVEIVEEAARELRAGLVAAAGPGPRSNWLTVPAWLRWVSWGAAVVALGAGAFLYSNAWATHSDYEDNPRTVSRDQAMRARRDAGIGIGLGAVGAALAVLPLFVEVEGTHADVVVGSNGGALRVRF